MADTRVSVSAVISTAEVCISRLLTGCSALLTLLEIGPAIDPSHVHLLAHEFFHLFVATVYRRSIKCQPKWRRLIVYRWMPPQVSWFVCFEQDGAISWAVPRYTSPCMLTGILGSVLFQRLPVQKRKHFEHCCSHPCYFHNGYRVSLATPRRPRLAPLPCR